MKIALDDGAKIPVRAHELDAGYDLFTREQVVIYAHDSATIDTGVHVEIPSGFVGFLKSKSGLNVKYGLTGTGVIDAGYTGPIVVKLYNHTDTPYMFDAGDKCIQLVLLPVYTPELEEVSIEEFNNSSRGDNGFGSTGKWFRDKIKERGNELCFQL